MGNTTLEAMADQLRKLGPKLTKESLPELANAARMELGKSIAAGQTSEGKEWKLTKAGGQALQNALQSAHAEVIGQLVLVTLTGPEARHHHGRGKGGVVRRVLPVGPLPAAWGRAFKAIVDRRFAEATRG